MSTHTRNPTEPQSRTDPRPTPDPSEKRDATAAEPSADAADDTDSWVDRCQRSFSATDTRRLRNLADDANEAMPNPE
ncbi:hypothetical protein [Halopelagius fulvigenes]|uniref:Uncharacterized protein n=1 Tax=Halopelagius fulvigenes TaxID=1198324 RepID=A0ABD5TVE4_9EURY